MLYLKQSTASQSIKLGPFVDSTDGVTAETALSIANTDIKLSKAGGTMAAKNSGGGTHDADGYYTITLDATDTNTVGSLQLSCSVTGALPVFKEFHVLEEAIYDALFGASASGFDANGRVDVGAVAGQTATAAAGVDFGDLATIETVTTAIGATGSGLSAVPWNAAWDAEVQSECTDALTAYNTVATTDLPSNFADLTISVTTGLVSLSADQSGVTIGTVNTAAALGAQAKLDVNAECDTALADYDAPTKTEMDSAFTEIKGATWSGTTDTLESIYNGVNGLSAASAPQLLQSTTIATLASQTSFTLTAGSADDDAYNGAIVIVTDSATSTQKAVGTVSDYVGATKTITLLSDPAIFTMAVGDTVDILAAISNAPTVQAIRSEMDANSTQLAAIVADTNELQTDWADGGRLDLILDARASQSSVNALPGAAEITTDITGSAEWAALLANIATVDTVVDAILVDTGTTLPATLAGLSTVTTSDIDARMAAIGLDHLLSASVTGADVADNSVIARLVSKSATADWDDFANTTDSLQAIRDRGDAAWVDGGGSASTPQLLQNTTIATLASQTSFTLTDGSTDDNAYNGCTLIVTDSATSTQKCIARVVDYVGSTKTITLLEDPGIFTMAAGDTVDVIAGVYVSSAGGTGVGWLG